MNPTDASDTIVQEITIKAPVERIFEALTNPDQRLKWWDVAAPWLGPEPLLEAKSIGPNGAMVARPPLMLTPRGQLPDAPSASGFALRLYSAFRIPKSAFHP
jgi:hypothetical protein